MTHKDETIIPSQRQKRILALAANVAQQSDHKTFHVGAVLVKGGSIINTSCNKVQWNSFASRFAHLKTRKNQGKRPEHASVHAEIGTILGLSRSLTKGADLYVVRVKSNGEYAMARPCGMCRGALTAVGVRRVFYTVNETEIEKMIIR